MTASRVLKRNRYGLLPPEDYNREMEEYGNPTIPESSIFSLTAGPLCIYLSSGIIIGVASKPSLISITLRIEKNAEGDSCDNPLELIKDLIPIEAVEELYSSSSLLQTIGRRVKRISVLR